MVVWHSVCARQHIEPSSPRPTYYGAGGIKDSWLVDYQATLNSMEAGRAAGASHFVLLSAICVQVRGHPAACLPWGKGGR